ncbi:hypothetical protein LIER_29384 [Lithospermum erythrorhizon]|uniref:Uncharacterized protein n=1 Tax=Lithospermum erythrorhizon TaxID=34254 RepID=A0AAV3RKJ3_LITER
MCMREFPYLATANPDIRQEPLATQSSSSSPDDSDTKSASSPIPQVTVTNKVASKIMPGNNDVMAHVPIKDACIEAVKSPVFVISGSQTLESVLNFEILNW